MVVLSTKEGHEVCFVQPKKLDVDLNRTQDFELRLAAADYLESMKPGCRIFIPFTEFGGIIGGIKTDTASNEIILTGRSWRGVLNVKIIAPPEGEDYKIISGELNDALNQLISEQQLDSLFSVSQEDTEQSLSSFRFDRYTTLLSGIEKALKSKGHRLEIIYAQGEAGTAGTVRLAAVPISDLSEQIELSQDSRLNFSFEEIKNGVNHLICLGQGELSGRIVADLFVQSDGTIGASQQYFGEDEVALVYEDTSAATEAELIERGTERLREVMNGSRLTMDIGSLSLLGVEIGDIIGGKDYITGITAAAPVANKIYKIENGNETVEYELAEGGEAFAPGIPGSSGGGAAITVDSTLSISSTNPVENRAISEILLATNKELPMSVSPWDGSVQEVTVEGSSEYISFLLILSDSGIVPVYKNGSLIGGVGGYSYNGYLLSLSANFRTSGDVWDWNEGLLKFQHIPGGTHSALNSNISVTKIIGLQKIIE